MVKMFEETVKSPIRGKRHGDIKTAVMSNEKVVVKVIKKVSNHRKAFAFHDNKGTDHSMVGKTLSSGSGVFLNRG